MVTEKCLKSRVYINMHIMKIVGILFNRRCFETGKLDIFQGSANKATAVAKNFALQKTMLIFYYKR